jgi:hypothetical protein
MKRLTPVLILSAVLFLALSGCAEPHVAAQEALAPICGQSSPNFFVGWWHGFIAVFSFIGKYLFGMNIAMYAPCGDGWYWFGYLMGAGVLFGGGSGGVSSRRNRD